MSTKITSVRNTIDFIETSIVEMQARLADFKSTLDSLEREHGSSKKVAPRVAPKVVPRLVNVVEKVKLTLLEDDPVYYGYLYMPSSDSSFFSEVLHGVRHEDYMASPEKSKCRSEEFDPKSSDWRRVALKVVQHLASAPMQTTEQLILIMRRFLQCLMVAGGFVTWTSESEPEIELLPDFSKTEREDLLEVLHKLYTRTLSNGAISRSEWSSFFLFNLLSQHKLLKSKTKVSVFFNDITFIIFNFVALFPDVIKVDQAVLRTCHHVPQHRSKHGLVSTLLHLQNGTFEYKYLFDNMLNFVGSKVFTRYIEAYMASNEVSLRDKLRHMLSTSVPSLDLFDTVMCFLLNMDNAKWSDKELFLIFSFLRRLPKNYETFEALREMFNMLAVNGAAKFYKAFMEYSMRFVMTSEKLKKRKCVSDDDLYGWVFHMVADPSLNPFDNKVIELSDLHFVMLLLNGAPALPESVAVYQSLSMKLLSLLLVLHYAIALNTEKDLEVIRLMLKVFLVFVSRHFPELLTSHSLYFEDDDDDSSFVNATFRHHVKDVFDSFVDSALFLVLNDNVDDIKLQMVMSNFQFDSEADENSTESSLAIFVRVCTAFCAKSQQNTIVDLQSLVDLMKLYSRTHSPFDLCQTEEQERLGYLISTFGYTKDDLDALMQLRSSWGSFAVTYASAVGNLNLLRWLLDEEADVSPDAMDAAAEYGNLDCMKLLVRNGCDGDVHTVALAALYGHLDVLKFLRVTGTPFDETAPRNAALANNKEILQWLYESGCPWDNQTTTVAAMACNLECMQFAMDNGCSFNLKIIAHYLSESLKLNR